MSQRDVVPDKLYQDADLAQFYDLDNDWGADRDYCLRLAEKARSVLDLGCGTGQLAARLAGDREVFGVDPASAMLALARRQPGGEVVTWVQADARTVRLDRRFDLVLLTGHAFQVFLSDADQRSALATIAAHLAPEGRFIFDSRNPAKQAWRSWTREASLRRFEHPSLGPIEAWNEAVHDPATGIVTYQTHYRVLADGRSYSASSRIYFNDLESLKGLIAETGLVVERWLGDWHGGALDPSSPDFIPIGGLVERVATPDIPS